MNEVTGSYIFSVGELAHIIDDASSTSRVNFVDSMKKYRGKVAIVTEVLRRNSGDRYRLDIDGGSFVWDYAWLEPVDTLGDVEPASLDELDELLLCGGR